MHVFPEIWVLSLNGCKQRYILQLCVIQCALDLNTNNVHKTVFIWKIDANSFN